jgi:hypothetical protein
MMDIYVNVEHSLKSFEQLQNSENAVVNIAES